METVLLLILCACVIAGRDIHLGSRPALHALAAALAASAVSQVTSMLAAAVAVGDTTLVSSVSVIALAGISIPTAPWLHSVSQLAFLTGSFLLVESVRRLRGERGALLVIVAVLGFAVVLAATVLSQALLNAIAAALSFGAFSVAALLSWQPGVGDSKRVRCGLSMTLGSLALLSLMRLSPVTESVARSLNVFVQGGGLNVLRQAAETLSLAAIGLTAPMLLALAIERQRNESHHDKQIDRVSGAASRSFLLAGAQAWIASLQREQVSTALIMIAIDQHHHTVSRFGRQVADDVLRHMVTSLRGALFGDTVIARYSGEQFCVLIPVGGEEEARRVAERLRSIVERSPYRDGAVTIALTVSVGLAMHRAGYALSDALSAADRRLYQASRGGDNRVIADEELFGSAIV